MLIRPPAYFPDANGNPAVGFKVYISEHDTDPKDSSKHLDIIDSNTGAVVSNPFVINSMGYPKNADGSLVSPQITQQSYAILFESIGGGQQFPAMNIEGDAFGLTDAGAAIVDASFNNFPLAQAADLSTFDSIYIQSQTAGWEGTPTGPVYGYLSHRTGVLGAPGTGTFDNFFDTPVGNQWIIDESSQLPLTNEVNVTANTASLVTNTANIGTNTTNITTNTANILTNTNDIAALQTAGSMKLTVITANDPAFVPETSTTSIEFMAVGGGGGAGSLDGNSTFGVSFAGGGGGTSIVSQSAPLDASYALVVGTGGAGGVGGSNSGQSGGDSTVISSSLNIEGGGGAGGVGVSSSGASLVINSPTTGGFAGGGDINAFGGNVPVAGQIGTVPIGAGLSGSSTFGPGVACKSNANGNNSFNIGEGGGSSFGSSATDRDGGDGGDGVIIIREFS